MYLSSQTIMDLAKLHSDELIQEADRQRLANRLWRPRRATESGGTESRATDGRATDSRRSGCRAEQHAVSRLEPGRAGRTVQVGRT
jgi:hypothetical protein